MSLPYNTLNQFHPDYDADYNWRLELLFKGGKDLLDNVGSFLVKMENESQAVYQNRLAYATYHPYFNEIGSDIVSQLFSKQLTVVPAVDANDPTTIGDVPEADGFYHEFSSDADLAEHSFSQCLSNIFKQALITKKAFIGIDFPKVDQLPSDILAEEKIELSLRDEEELQLSRAYVYQVPVCTVINWEKDAFGEFKWLILKSEAPIIQPLKPITHKTISFKYWFIEGSEVKFQVYEIVCKVNKEPKPTDQVQLVEEGGVSFTSIPIKELELPDELWLGNIIYPLIIEHLKQRSSLVFAQMRSLFPIVFYQQSGELENIGNPVGDRSSRGDSMRRDLVNKGFLVGTDKDDLKMIELKGESFALINQQLKELVDEIHRVVHQMASSISATSTAVGRSGASKIEDNRAKEIVLGAYASYIKDFAKKVYTAIAQGRKEDVIWQVMGMQDYKVVDRDVLLNEVKTLPVVKQNILSKTAYKLYLNNIVGQLNPDASPETQMTIQSEIDQAVEQMDLEAPEEAAEETLTNDNK